MAEVKTVREHCVLFFKTLLDNAITEDASKLFSTVSRGTIDDLEIAEAFPAVSIEEADEEVLKQLYPYVDKNLRLFIHFRFHNDENVDASEEFNYYLGILQTLLLEDHTMNKYGYNVQEVGSSTEIEEEDDFAGGVLFLDISYRHTNGNPYEGAFQDD